MLYRVADLLIEASFPVPELPVAGSGTPEVCVVESTAGEVHGARWYHEWCADGETPWLRFGHGPGGYLLRFPDLADFSISSDASAVTVYRARGTPDVTLRHLLVDQVVPLVLSHRGRLVVHASAVETTAGAVAFAGMSGQGKSTLAASLAAAGFPLVSDDCLVLQAAAGQWMATPAYPGVRLWERSSAHLFPGHDGNDVAHDNEHGTLRRVSPRLACGTTPQCALALLRS